MPVPPDAKIYHIVHVDRLTSIIASNGLHCDSFMQGRAHPGTTIGMPQLKQTRLNQPVDVFPGTAVGDYVPFYFCSRSVMLYVIYMRNHPGLLYTGGQEPIVHLEADLMGVLDWADANGIDWALSLGNATANYAEFRSTRQELEEVRWDLIHERLWRDPAVKEAKQSELLIKGFFPWTLFDRIGTASDAVAQQAAQIIQASDHRPLVQRMTNWYYG
jgi:hypothetical protein